jgi:hypothetical protein
VIEKNMRQVNEIENFFKNIVGKKIVQIDRQIFKDDMDFENFELEADGVVQLILDSDEFISFYQNTEELSLGIEISPMRKMGESYKYIMLDRDSFWINKKIVNVKILSGNDSSDYREEPCCQIKFEDNTSLFIEYCVDDDRLRLGDRPLGQYNDMV